MKKFFTLLSLAVLACVSAIAAINWNAVDNLAKGATVTVSSKPAEANNICDDNNGTGWQAVAATHPYTHDWVLINLGESKTFTDMEIVWEASHCKEYSVYVSDSAIPYQEKTFTVKEAEGENPAETISCNVIDEAWLAANTPVKTGGDSSEAGYTENFNFDPAQKGQYILIYANEYNNYGRDYGMRIFDVKIANIEGRDEVASLQLTQEGNAVAGGDPVNVTVVPVNKIGDTMELTAVSDLKLTCDNAAVTITGGENGKYSVSASEVGTYTLTATATAKGATVSGTMTLSVAYNWNGIANIATGKTIQGRVKADTEDPNPPANAVDGNLETYYQYNGEWGGGDGWLLVDLGDEYMVSAIGAYYSTNAGGKCVFGYATDATAVMAEIAKGTDFRWTNDLAFNAGWTFTNELARTADAITTQAYATPVVARYIVIKDADNPQGKPCVNEIYVSGVKREAAKADKIELNLEKDGLVIGETNTVTATVVDQYGEPFEGTPTITVTGAEYANGTITGNAKGMVTVTAALDGITAEKKFFVADENDYCLAGATVTSSNPDAVAAAATDGGKVITNNGEIYVIANNETPGAHEHWMLVKLAKPYNLDLIDLNWEGACPADYDVYVGKTENELVKTYSKTDKPGMQASSDRFSGKEMTDIQYIKVVTTKNATEYGVKLFDIKAYGTSNAVSVPTSIEVTASDNYIATETSVTLSAKVFDQYGAEMPDETVIYNADGGDINGNVFSAATTGTYTVTATCGNIEGSIDIYVIADANNTASAVEVTLDGEPVDANTTIMIPTVPATLKYVFAEPKNFTLINFRWEASCPADYTVTVTYANGSTATVLSVSGREFVGGFNPVDKIIGSAGRASNNANLNNVKEITLYLEKKVNNDWNLQLWGMDAYTDGHSSAIDNIIVDGNAIVDVYNLQGVKVRSKVKAENALDDLPRGIYIVGGRKVMR